MDGERNAFTPIVTRYETRVFSLVLMMTRDRLAAEELTQDVFFRAYSNLAKFELERPFYPWLATIAVRLALNWINRTAARQNRTTSDHDPAEMPARRADPGEVLQSRQDSRKIWNLVASLPQGERTAVLMFYKQELKVSEIANILGVTPGTIKTFLHRGRKHLYTHLVAKGIET